MPDEPMWCIGCGKIGPEWVERAPMDGDPPAPTVIVRVCPPCFGKGWRLASPAKERRPGLQRVK